MNSNMQRIMEDALKKIEQMTPEELHLSFFGFTKEQEEAYTAESFAADLEYLKGFMVDEKYYVFEPKYDNLPQPKMSKLFWNYINNNSRSYEGDDEYWPEHIQELPQFSIRISTIHGQGSITTVEYFDYSSPEYIARNAIRLKREAVITQQRKIDELLNGLPREFDEVQFSTEINGTCINDTGVVKRVYTKKKKVRYLIDSVYHGDVMVYVNSTDYPNDTITVLDKYYDGNDQSFGM